MGRAVRQGDGSRFIHDKGRLAVDEGQLRPRPRLDLTPSRPARLLRN